jgi:hypothetical protein
VSNSCNFIAQGVRFYVTFNRKKIVYLLSTNTNLKNLVLGRSYQILELQVEPLMYGPTINTGLRLCSFPEVTLIRPVKRLKLFPGCFYK